ncbi:MAG: ATP-binding protein, partial [Lachnospiraceae bacterium]|nr:ATP-binding protein [Lachnospiraceae bacterium]
GNIVEHGFNDGKKHSVDVRIVAADEPLTIRIRDDCPAFDPAKYMEQFSHEDPSKNAGLRLIAGIAKSINYQNNAGINTLLINV